MTGPLSGYRILDLSAVLSGPIATAWLNDQGAEVIKVEAFAGDVTRHIQGGVDGLTPIFVSSNRGKKGLAIDLKTEAGTDVLRRMIPMVDVIVQNFRPGAVERLGLDYDSATKLKPDIIYCSISGFGSEGPYSSKRIYDPIIQGLSGLNAMQAGPDGAPKSIRATITDVVTALTAAQAITAALLARERTGKGQHVTLAMIDAIVALAWSSAMASAMLVDSEQPERRVHQPGDSYIFETADGFITAIAVSESEWQGMCQALDREDLLDHEILNNTASRTANISMLHELLAPMLKEKTSGHWLKLFDESGVPCGPVLAPSDVPDNEQIIANKLVEVIDHPGLGKLRQARPPARFSETPADIQGPAPKLGEHTRKILEQFQFTDTEINELISSGVVQQH